MYMYMCVYVYMYGAVVTSAAGYVPYIYIYIYICIYICKNIYVCM